MEFVGHLAFGLIAISYLFRDILWLRALSICASIAGIAYNYFAPASPLWLVVYWNLGFIAVNVFMIGVLVYERHGIRFNDAEQELYDTVFHTFSPVQYMKLLRVSTWRDIPAGETLAECGQPLDALLLICDGTVRVSRKDHTLAELKDGQFVGEVSFVQEQPATATVTCKSPVRLLSWKKSDLRQLLSRNPSLRTALDVVIAGDLAQKLKHQRTSLGASGVRRIAQ